MKNSKGNVRLVCAWVGVSLGAFGCSASTSTSNTGSGGGSSGVASGGGKTEAGSGSSVGGGSSTASSNGSAGSSVSGGQSDAAGSSRSGGSAGGTSAAAGASVTGGSAGGSSRTAVTTGAGGNSGTAGATSSGGVAGGRSGGAGATGVAGSAGGTSKTAATTGAGGSSGGGGATGAAGSSGSGSLPGDVAKAAGTPMVAAHSLTRAMFAAYTGPLFKVMRVSDKQEKDIGSVAATGLVDLSTLSTFCSGTTCKLATLYDQSGNTNDMWRGDTTANAPGTPKLCELLDIEYWQMSDGTKVPIALGRGWGAGEEWTRTSQCLRNRDKTKNMPKGATPQTTYAIFHQKYVNPGCCFNYGNTGNQIHYTGPGTLSALNFSKVAYWSKGTGTGPWVMVDWETGVYAGNIAKCNSGAACTDCTSTGANENPTVLHEIVSTVFKHNGVNHWALKAGNAKTGALAVSIDLPALPKGYSPLKQEGGLGLGEGGAGDAGGSGGFSEGAIIAAETTDETDNAIQKSIVSVFGK